MGCSMAEQKQAVQCGYQLLMRYDGEKLMLDSNKPNFTLYEEFLNNEVRYNTLKIKNKELAQVLLDNQKENAIKRYEYYKKLV